MMTKRQEARIEQMIEELVKFPATKGHYYFNDIGDLCMRGSQRGIGIIIVRSTWRQHRFDSVYKYLSKALDKLYEKLI